MSEITTRDRSVTRYLIPRALVSLSMALDFNMAGSATPGILGLTQSGPVFLSVGSEYKFLTALATHKDAAVNSF